MGVQNPPAPPPVRSLMLVKRIRMTFVVVVFLEGVPIATFENGVGWKGSRIVCSNDSSVGHQGLWYISPGKAGLNYTKRSVSPIFTVPSYASAISFLVGGEYDF